jgi:ACT domain-containing protein
MSKKNKNKKIRAEGVKLTNDTLVAPKLEITLEDIKTAFFDTAGNVTDAIKLLGISKTHFYRYYRKFPELQSIRMEAMELRKLDLTETALGALLSVAESNGSSYGYNAAAKVKAGEALAKIAGLLVEKQEIKSKNENINVNNNLDLSSMSDDKLDEQLKKIREIHEPGS